MALSKIPSSGTYFDERPSSFCVPSWARDAIAVAIQNLDTPTWRDAISQHLPVFCETIPRLRDVFVSSDVQALERVLLEVFKGSSRFHSALRFLNMPIPCDYTLLSPSDAITIRTGYILCFIFRFIDLLYHYANDVLPPSEHFDSAYLGKRIEQSVFGGAVTLIYMNSFGRLLIRSYPYFSQELHIATEYISETTEKPTYAPLTREIVGALNNPSNSDMGTESVESEFICGYLGRHQLRPIDAIVSEQFGRNAEAQVAWEILLEGYRCRRKRAFMRNIVMRIFR